MDKVLHMVLYLRCTIMDLKKKKKKKKKNTKVCSVNLKWKQG